MSEELTKAQKDRIEKCKRKAIALKKGRLTAHPYSKGKVISTDKIKLKSATKCKDIGGEFLYKKIDKTDEAAAIKRELCKLTCEECKKIFTESYLFNNFAHKVCDSCRNREVHKLISKTLAQNEYLLNDCDLFKREPPLKYIIVKNRSNPFWCEMKLFLQIQVEKRALEIWGSEERIREQKEKREKIKLKREIKKCRKQSKESSMSKPVVLYEPHVHKFGPETYNEEEDNYSHSCKTCKFAVTFEKM